MSLPSCVTASAVLGFSWAIGGQELEAAGWKCLTGITQRLTDFATRLAPVVSLANNSRTTTKKDYPMNRELLQFVLFGEPPLPYENTGGPKDPPSDQSTYQDPNDDEDVLDEGSPDEPDNDED